MQSHGFAASDGSTITLDLCFACQGLWFDRHENTRLSPTAVMELFELLHAHRSEAAQPLAVQMRCVRCRTPLVRGFDVAQGGRYLTWRCPQRDGRFSTFGSFMVEKGFVRHLAPAEIAALAERVGTVRCTGCGGPINLRKEDACPWCRSALSLLDPEAVEQALQRHGTAARQRSQSQTPQALADALIAIERQNAREQRERQRERQPEHWSSGVDLLATGLDMLWRLWRR